MKYSDSERAAWKERMGALIQEIRKLSPERRAELADKMPIYTPEGHQLSVFNMCFLSAQSGRGDLTVCGGFRQWERTGHVVRGGERAVGYIYVPTGKKDAETGQIDPDEKLRFRLVPVFDVSQTEAAQAAA